MREREREREGEREEGERERGGRQHATCVHGHRAGIRFGVIFEAHPSVGEALLVVARHLSQADLVMMVGGQARSVVVAVKANPVIRAALILL